MNISQVIKHIGYNTDPNLLTDYFVANISWEYIYSVTVMVKKVQKYIFTKLQVTVLSLCYWKAAGYGLITYVHYL
jgi:hypothetical protein